MDKNFNFYFRGRERIPPLKAFESLKKEINNLMEVKEKLKNTHEKYMVLSLIQKFSSYRIKWEKGIRDIEEGRAVPGKSFFGGFSSKAEDFKEVDIKKVKKNSCFRVEEAIEEATEKYIKISKEYFGNNVSKEAVSRMLQRRIHEVIKKVGNEFRFNVYVENGKVKIRPEKV